MKKLRKLLKRRWVIVLLVVFLILGARFFGGKPSDKPRSYTVARQNLRQTLALSGTVEAGEKVTLRFQTSGRLVWLGVKPGDVVAAHQGVASLDQREVHKKLEHTLNSYLKTRWDFEQLQNDYESKILTDAIKRILEKSQFDLNNAVLDVELQDLAVEFSTLASPIAGIVTRVTPGVAGVNVTPANAEIEVVNPNSIYLSVVADQTEVTQLKDDLTTDIVFDAYPAEHIEGKVISIGFAPKPDETSTVYEVKIKLATTNDRYRYRLGMTADSAFILKEKPNVLAIPTQFVVGEGDKSYVFTMVRGRKEKREVTLGEEGEELIEITSGLKEGDVVYHE